MIQKRHTTSLSGFLQGRKAGFRTCHRAVRHLHQRGRYLALRGQTWWLFIGPLLRAFGDIPVKLRKCGRMPC